MNCGIYFTYINMHALDGYIYTTDYTVLKK